MLQDKQLNEYQAAAKVGLSPTLLRWLAKYAPKEGSSRKLKVTKTQEGVLLVDEEELLSFNEWLKLPWPQKEGKRPPIPSGIREEIKTEANGECAVCQSHKDTCEAAHLDPVATSRNNHPENLLWLCGNHHIAYDGGLFGPDEENAEFVRTFKRALHRHKKMLWGMQDEVSRKLFSVLSECHLLAEQLTLAKTKAQVDAVERLATRTLAIVPKLGPVSRADPHYKAYQSISVSLSSLATSINREPKNVRAKLGEAQDIQKKYITALGFVICPLCKGTGQHDGYDCPECAGDGEMPRRIAEQVDLDQYKDVRCPLCRGEGTFHGEDCPECGGERTMPQWRAEQVDVNQYKDVKCPLCKGEGTFHDEDCPECGGERTMPQWRAEQVDVNQYKDLKCPLCKGEGTFHGEDCPECGGERTMPQWRAERVDVNQFKDVKCPLCKGEGTFRGEDCPECGGEREMPRLQAEQVDLTQYQDVDCPQCSGTGRFRGDDCSFCEGERKVPRRVADDFEAS